MNIDKGIFRICLVVWPFLSFLIFLQQVDPIEQNYISYKKYKEEAVMSCELVDIGFCHSDYSDGTNKKFFLPSPKGEDWTKESCEEDHDLKFAIRKLTEKSYATEANCLAAKKISTKEKNKLLIENFVIMIFIILTPLLIYPLYKLIKLIVMWIYRGFRNK